MLTGNDLLPDSSKPLHDHSELQLLCMVVFGEARGEPVDTRLAIAHAIVNRALHPGWWGHDLTEVILKPWQFSSFNGPEVIPTIDESRIDPNYVKLRRPLDFEPMTVWDACCQAAIAAYARIADAQVPDVVRGANHYYDTSIPEPNWADAQKLVLALPASRPGHEVRFYKL